MKTFAMCVLTLAVGLVRFDSAFAAGLSGFLCAVFTSMVWTEREK